jgi:hypothetical protein
MYYAIEKIGRAYVLRQVMPGRGVNPVNGIRYKTEKAARDSAALLGLEIGRCGGFWEIV